MDSIQWVAIYDDGTKLHQYNGNEVNKYEDINRDKLVGFALYKNDEPLLLVDFEEGQRLVYRRRNFMRFDGSKSSVFLVGRQQTIDGKNIQSIACVFDDGSIRMINKWDDQNVLFAEPNIKDFENGKI